jgi:hypothetical protein
MIQFALTITSFAKRGKTEEIAEPQKGQDDVHQLALGLESIVEVDYKSNFFFTRNLNSKEQRRRHLLINSDLVPLMLVRKRSTRALSREFSFHVLPLPKMNIRV